MPPLPHESALQYLARIGKAQVRQLPAVLEAAIERGKSHPVGLLMIGWNC